jgi:hypothetical protein
MLLNKSALIVEERGEELRIRLPSASIHFSFRLIARLTDAIQQGAALDSQKEIGGIVFGTISQEVSVPNADVELFVPIPCSSGPLYHLSESDISGLPDHIEAMGLSSLTVIGLYRTHCRPGLGLDPEDVRLTDEFLRQPGSFFLILKPEAGQELRAALFLRGAQSISSDPALTFPFDYIQPDGPITHGLPSDTSEVAVKREKGWRTWAAAGGVAVLLAAVLLSGRGWVNRHTIAKPPEIARITAAPAALHLRGAIELDHLRINWGPNASKVGLGGGTLVITDSDTTTQIPLDNSLLKRGSVEYYPRSTTVRFELRIGEASDVILIAGARPSQSQPLAEQRAETKPPIPRRTAPEPALKPISPAPSEAIDNRSIETRIQREESLVRPPEAPAEPIISQTTPTPGSTQPVPPGISPTKPVSPPTQAVTLAPPAAQTSASPPIVAPRFLEASPIEHHIKKSVEPQISPDIDRLISSKVTIRVKVSIDDQGRVVQAEALTRGEPLVNDLAEAAVNAARLWLFEPAHRAGRNVPSEAILNFDFGHGS